MRTRKNLTMNQVKYKGTPPRAFIFVKHPVRKKTVCFSLGLAAEAPGNIEKLNAVYMDVTLHLNPPQDKLPARLWEQWVGPDNVLSLHGSGKTMQGGKVNTDTPEEVAIVRAEKDGLHRQIEALLKKVERQGLELEALRGAKYRKGTFPTLGEAKSAFMAAYTGRDRSHTYNVSWDLDRFVAKFGAHVKADELEGREDEISSWLRSLKVGEKYIGPSRRMFIRTYAIALLKFAGAMIDKSKVERPSKKDIKTARGPIRWLSKDQAEKVLKHLPAYFADAFNLQVAVGLRPSEILTLKRSDFTDDFTELTLSPLGELSLKTGSRTLPIPEALRPMLALRARVCDIIFPEPVGKVVRKARAKKNATRSRMGQAEGGRPWRDPKAFDRRFFKALKAAALKAKINILVDSRIGRRTCASLLLQGNVSADKIAALLGNSAAMILSHYGSPDTRNLDLSATSLTETKSDLKKEKRFLSSKRR